MFSEVRKKIEFVSEGIRKEFELFIAGRTYVVRSVLGNHGIALFAFKLNYKKSLGFLFYICIVFVNCRTPNTHGETEYHYIDIKNSSCHSASRPTRVTELKSDVNVVLCCQTTGALVELISFWFVADGFS